MTNRRKILIHSIAFSPDGVSTAYLYNDLAKKLNGSGYDVIVLTTTPHYNVVAEALERQPLKRRLGGLYFVSSFEGIPVIHVPQKKFKSTALRILGFLYWHILSFIIGLCQGNVSLILSPSPPLTIGLINITLAFFKRAKVIYNVQEIYPDFLIEQGGLRSSIVIRFLKSLERFVYNKSDAVTTIDKMFYNTIVSRFTDKSKLRVIPNFVDTELYRPFLGELPIDRILFPKNDRLKLMYAGNIGHAQDWEPLLESAIQLKEYPVDFYVIGEGVVKPYLETEIERLGLNNIKLLPYQNREQIPNLLAFSDIQFIFMSKKMENHGFPSKVYTIMACKKPLLICSGRQTPIANFLEPINCAKLITTSQKEEKVSEIVSFVKNITKQELEQMADRGYKVVQSQYTKEVVTNQYKELIDDLLVR
jgi:colanic acid biosynthesis glycosyl transferase WcaI